MISKKKWILIVVLLVAALLVRIMSVYTHFIEKYYSSGFYGYIAAFFRHLVGWLPFSLGDILYGVAAIYLLYKTVRGIRAIIKKQISWPYFFMKLSSGLIILLAIYIIFNLFWGINYNRQGIATQLGLNMDKYTAQQLIAIDSILLHKVNENKLAILKYGKINFKSSQVFTRSVAAYAEADKKYPFLQYHTPSVKASLWGWLGNYLGFSGYYNPFTGEAQVNTTIPKFLQPYTTCHEIAHQLGYAKENEANFVGYLAATSSKDSLFLYSAYLELFLYTERNLYSIDTTKAKYFAKQLLPQVQADIKEWRDFNNSHQSPVEPVIRWMYGKYLQSNQQPSGNLSYDEVTGLLVAYYKKYGTL